MKKLSTLQKWYLKYTNRNDYNQYKLDLKNIIEVEFIERTKEIKHVSLNHLYKKSTTFIHSGNSGDIIYALPSVFELSKNGKAKLYLKADQQGTYPNYHPLGGVMLNDKMIEMLIPLFAYQPQIELCKKYEEELIDYNLDEFRKYSFLFDKGSIIRWYFQVYGITSNTSLPWLVAPKNQKYEEAIVIARSHRYRSPLINYKFLEKYSNLFFVGVNEEYNDIKNQISNIEFIAVNDFLELATIINSCKLFIGNQSFPFALAEALKVKRLLEVCYMCPNVIVEGEGANDFMYQPQFEYSVKRLLG